MSLSNDQIQTNYCFVKFNTACRRQTELALSVRTKVDDVHDSNLRAKRALAEEEGNLKTMLDTLAAFDYAKTPEELKRIKMLSDVFEAANKEAYGKMLQDLGFACDEDGSGPLALATWDTLQPGKHMYSFVRVLPEPIPGRKNCVAAELVAKISSKQKTAPFPEAAVRATNGKPSILVATTAENALEQAEVVFSLKNLERLYCFERDVAELEMACDDYKRALVSLSVAALGALLPEEHKFKDAHALVAALNERARAEEREEARASALALAALRARDKVRRAERRRRAQQVSGADALMLLRDPVGIPSDASSSAGASSSSGLSILTQAAFQEQGESLGFELVIEEID